MSLGEVSLFGILIFRLEKVRVRNSFFDPREKARSVELVEQGKGASLFLFLLIRDSWTLFLACFFCSLEMSQPLSLLRNLFSNGSAMNIEKCSAGPIVAAETKMNLSCLGG